jgi:hypothetical protein
MFSTTKFWIALRGVILLTYKVFWNSDNLKWIYEPIKDLK